MIWLFATAFAASPALMAGVTGGYDYPTSQWFGGGEFSVMPRNTSGLSPVGRLIAGYGHKGLPLLTLEAGGLFVVPNEEARIRFGGVIRPSMTVSDARLPLQFADPHDGPAAGLMLGGQVWLEFEWGDVGTPFTLGVKAGVAQFASDFACQGESPDFATCRLWQVGAIGSFFLRKTFTGGFSVQLEAGTIPTLSARWVLNPVR